MRTSIIHMGIPLWLLKKIIPPSRENRFYMNICRMQYSNVLTVMRDCNIYFGVGIVGTSALKEAGEEGQVAAPMSAIDGFLEEKFA